MTVEIAQHPTQLNAALPPQSDIVREGAGHLRLLKTVVKTTFPNLGGAWNATQTEANYIVGVTSPIQAQINSKGAITGQTWTGAHVFSGTATLPAATTIGAVTAAELAHLSGVTSPIQTQFAAKASLSGATYTGAHNYSGASSVTLPAATSIGSITATELGYVDGVTAPIQAQLGGKADIAGESYTGTHDFTGAFIAVPTLPPGSSGSGAASVAYANALAFASSLPAQPGNAGKFVKTNGAVANWSSITFAELTSKPTTVGGYGITDAVATSGDQTIAGNKSFSGNLLAIGGALGYGVGAGGTVVQATSKSTAVTLNKPSGGIAMHNAPLAAGATVAFQLANSLLMTTDGLVINCIGGVSSLASYRFSYGVTANGIVAIYVTNETGVSLSETIVLNFQIIKGAMS